MGTCQRARFMYNVKPCQWSFAATSRVNRPLIGHFTGDNKTNKGFVEGSAAAPRRACRTICSKRSFCFAHARSLRRRHTYNPTNKEAALWVGLWAAPLAGAEILVAALEGARQRGLRLTPAPARASIVALGLEAHRDFFLWVGHHFGTIRRRNGAALDARTDSSYCTRGANLQSGSGTPADPRGILHNCSIRVVAMLLL
jgi:hypothetical protein